MGKTAVNQAISATRSTIVETGKAALHAMAPNDYEYYLCSLELYDSSLQKVGFLSFVVMPNQIIENHTPIQTITKTHGGIVTTFNQSFNPIDINISGTFGKKFRLVNGLQDPIDLSVGKINKSKVGTKSGYGLIKVLEHILKESNKTDALGKPTILIFNNYAFNTHYVVEVTGYTFQQSYEQNMMWNYQINMRAVGYKPTKLATSTADFLKQVASNSISNGLNTMINKMAGTAYGAISNGLDDIGLSKLGI
jgi:hypothetical protein